MNKLTASVSAVILATLVGCAAPVSNGSDEATLSSSELGTEGKAVTPAPLPPVVAGLELSAAGTSSQTYPDAPQYTFNGTTEKIYVWAYMENLTPGTHVAWAQIVNPSGAVIVTVPLAFSTKKADVGTFATLANWPNPIKIKDGRPGEMEAIAGTIVGSETHGHFPVSDLKIKKALQTGMYTVNLIMNDTAFPAPTQAPVTSRTFIVTGP